MSTTLLELLAKRFPESSRTKLREIIAAKRVLVNGKPAITLKQPVSESAKLEILDRVAARTRAVGKLPFRVVHEDADLLVIEKPESAITSSGPKDKRATVIDILTDYYSQIDPRVEIGLVHRLDKDASGLLVFSKNPASFEALKAQFAAKTAKRIYHAIVLGIPDPKFGKIESKLVELGDGTVRSTRHRDHGEEAITHYQTLATRGKHTLVEVRLETGRKHQIRVHLSEKTLPIAGDTLYHPHANQAPRLMLAAVELELIHPRTEQPMKWRIEPAPAMTAWWDLQLPQHHNRPPRKRG